MDGTFVVTSGKRSFIEQARLWARYKAGRSSLPANPPGTSMHELGLAIDIARPGVDPLDDDLLDALGQAWTEGGGVWGGNYEHVDPVHFEPPNARAIMGKHSEDAARGIVTWHHQVDEAALQYLIDALGFDDDDDS